MQKQGAFEHKSSSVSFRSLSIGAFTGNLAKEEVQQACEENTVKNVQAWSKNNIAKTAFSKRKIE